MQCSRCLTELPDATTYCSNCGTFLRSDPSGASTVFSYLPAGAPPWPTTIPQNLRGATRQTLDVVGSNQAIKTGRSKRSVLQIAGVLLLIPLLGVASTLGILYTQGRFPAQASANQQPASKLNASALTPTVVPTGTAAQQTNVLPTPTSFKKESNQDINISLQYPSDWIVEAPQTSSQDVSIDIHPQQQLGIGFLISHLNDSTSAQLHSADEVNQGSLSSISGSQNVSNLQTIPTADPQPTIGGTQWTQQDAMFLNPNGDKFHLTTISVQHKNNYYNILFFAPDIYYNEAVQKYTQPMLNSIQFLS